MPQINSRVVAIAACAMIAIAFPSATMARGGGSSGGGHFGADVLREGGRIEQLAKPQEPHQPIGGGRVV